ncbi:hypothetical protein [uncultured Algibacter sp.]|uniref:hypothetical protein n=1 Tax=uncultured Algibacter sp. TaxID=298659 RepID=UPI0026200628|nr:hypothetical protein [uncultured Algibacter sp.]
MENENLVNVLKTLFHLQTQINLTVESLNEIEQNQKILEKIQIENYFDNSMNLKISTSGILSNYSIILFCSFLEEYHKFFNLGHLKSVDRNLILSVKNKNKPGIRRINKWTGLIDFRNQLIAHNFRIKDKSFFSKEKLLYDYKIPNSLSEKNLFSGIIYLICLNIRDAFPEIISKLNLNERMVDKLNLIGENVDNENELKKLFDKMK